MASAFPSPFKKANCSMAATVLTRWNGPMPIVRSGALNLLVVHVETIDSSVDPYAFVLSANIRRRHLKNSRTKTRSDRRAAESAAGTIQSSDRKTCRCMLKTHPRQARILQIKARPSVKKPLQNKGRSD